MMLVFFRYLLVFLVVISLQQVNTSFSQDGSLDPTFGTGGIVVTPIGTGDDIGFSVAVQEDGKIVVVGYSDNGTNDDVSMVRYNSDGSLDDTFGTAGKVVTSLGASEQCYAVAIQVDGKIVVSGTSFNGSDYDITLFRYLTDGSLDATFDADGIVQTAIGSFNNDYAYSLLIQNDGKIVVAGETSPGGWSDFALVRFNGDGSLDTSFDGDGIVTTPVTPFHDDAYSVVIQDDGKIIAAGIACDAINCFFAIARLNTDGSLDATFDLDGVVVTSVGPYNEGGAFSVVVQTDGKIIVGGSCFDGSNNDFTLVRYNSDGGLDNSFDTDGIVISPIGTGGDSGSSLALQVDGKIILAGNSLVGSNANFTLVRYNSNGSLDGTFDSDGIVTTSIGPSNSWGTSTSIQVDGKIILAGWSSNGTDADFTVARYNGMGSDQILPTTEAEEIQIFPNPSSGILTLQARGNENASVKIFNALGTEVLSLSLTENTKISLAQPGVYFARISNGGKIRTEKIVIQ